MRIVVTPAELYLLSDRFTTVGTELTSIAGRLRQVYFSLDWEVRQEAGVERILGDALELIQEASGQSERLAAWVRAKGETFERVDREACDGFTGTGSAVEAIAVENMQNHPHSFLPGFLDNLAGLAGWGPFGGLANLGQDALAGSQFFSSVFIAANMAQDYYNYGVGNRPRKGNKVYVRPPKWIRSDWLADFMRGQVGLPGSHIRWERDVERILQPITGSGLTKARRLGGELADDFKTPIGKVNYALGVWDTLSEDRYQEDKSLMATALALNTTEQVVSTGAGIMVGSAVCAFTGPVTAGAGCVAGVAAGVATSSAIDYAWGKWGQDGAIENVNKGVEWVGGFF